MSGCTQNCNNCPVFICAYNKTPGLDHVKEDKDKQGQTMTNDDIVSYSVHKNNKFNIRR